MFIVSKGILSLYYIKYVYVIYRYKFDLFHDVKDGHILFSLNS